MRPKTFVGYRDRGNFETATVVLETTIANSDGLPLSFDRGSAEKWGAEVGRLFHRTVNGYRDPLCGANVAYALIISSPHGYIRAPQLTGHLNRMAPHFQWDPVTVGRILSDMADQSQEAFGGDPLQAALMAGMDSKGRYYVVRNGYDARLWLMKVMSLFLAESHRVMREEADGDVVRKPEYLFQPIMDEDGVVAPDVR